MSAVDSSEFKRVLVIRTGAIGDILLTTPFIRSLKKAIPLCEIDYLCEPMGLQILTGNPYLSNIIVFEKNRLKKSNLFAKITETLKFYSDLRKRGYDAVFDLFGNTRTAIMALATCARYRVGFTFRGRKYLYNIRVKPAKEPQYNVFYHGQLLEPFGLKLDSEKLDFYISDEDEKFAKDFIYSLNLEKDKRLFVFNPAGTWVTKRWPEEKFAELADLLDAKIPGASIIILWGPGEMQMAEKILSLTANRNKRVFLAPQTTIKRMGALLKYADVVVGNDGAGKHVALAVGTKTITIFGPTNPVSWNPANEKNSVAVVAGEQCSPCDKTECSHISCMKNVTPEMVFKKIKIIISSERNPPASAVDELYPSE